MNIKKETKELQTQLMEVYKVVVEALKKMDIKPKAAWGTLLGAVRHKGLIPWDDDIDLVVTKEEMIRINEEIENYLPDDYIFNSFEKHKKYPLLIAKVVKKNSGFTEHGFKDNTPWEQGLFVDLFVLIETTDEKMKKTKMAKLFYRVASAKFVPWSSRALPIMLIGKLLSYCTPSFIYKKIILRKTKKMVSKDSGRVAFESEFGQNTLPKEYFEEWHKVPFEESSIWIPKRYNEILEQHYGDWKKIPKENEMQQAHFK